MNKFLFQIDKQEREDLIELYLFFVNNGKTILDKTSIPYTILAKKDDFESLKIKTDSIILADREFRNKKNEKIVKIEIKNKELYNYLLTKFKDANYETYETDLPTEHLCLIDRGLRIGDLKELKSNNPFKIASIDIESIGSSIDTQEIILISTYSPNNKKFNKVYINLEKLPEKKLETLKKEKWDGFSIDICINEKELLEKFKKDIIELEPQIIIGWNVIDFDFKVIKQRMSEHSIEFKFSNFEGDCKLRINSEFFRDSTMICPGVIIFDIIQILKTNFIQFDDYKLNTVAKEVLKDEKININVEDDSDFIEDKCKAIEYMFTSNPSLLINYNFKDSLLTYKICEKLKLLELMMQRSLITNTPLLKVKSPIASLDIMYLEELHKMGYVANSNFNFNSQTPIEGAFVIEPKKGFYEDIFVLDFKSLYPSIIMTFNIDPFTYQENGQIEAPNGAKFVKEEGILPKLILQLYKERDNAKKEKDKVKSNALKITMNSFYGAMASPKSRFYNKDVGGAITSFGRHIIQTAKLHIEKIGHQVVYGDTDSVFVRIKNTENKNLDEKIKIGKELEKELNKYFENWVKEKFGQKSYLNIEFEKLYSKFFIASKKRYVGYDEFEKKTSYTGMEAIRGDWTPLAQNFQMELVNRVFLEKSKKNIENFIKDYINKLKNGDYDQQLIYTKKITKPLNQYTKTTPPHVKAAREVEKFAGKVVKYVMTKDGPKHISILSKPVNYDYQHYIEKQLKGVADDILEALDIDFDIATNQKEKSLSNFF